MNVVSKITFIILGSCILAFAPAGRVSAQDPVTEAIRRAVVKVIKAIDLQMQRMQTKTIWLQNAQKVVENTMTELQLNEISDWATKQKKLYQDYFDELRDVKRILVDYHEIKTAVAKQAMMVREYKRAFGLLKQDKHFSPDEIKYMSTVYEGIIASSLKNLDQVFLMLKPDLTSMNDSDRLKLMQRATAAIASNYEDLMTFNSQNIQLSLERGRDLKEVESLKQLYGLK